MDLSEILVIAGNTEIFKAKAKDIGKADLVLLKKVLEGQIVDLRDQISDLESRNDDPSIPERLQRKNFVLKKKRYLCSLVDGYLGAIAAREKESRAAEHAKTQAASDRYLRHFHAISKAILSETQYQQIRKAALEKVSLEP